MSPRSVSVELRDRAVSRLGGCLFLVLTGTVLALPASIVLVPAGPNASLIVAGPLIVIGGLLSTGLGIAWWRRRNRPTAVVRFETDALLPGVTCTVRWVISGPLEGLQGLSLQAVARSGERGPEVHRLPITQEEGPVQAEGSATLVVPPDVPRAAWWTLHLTASPSLALEAELPLRPS